jgi:hypothetical protein
MIINKHLLQVLLRGKYLEFLTSLNTEYPNNLEVIALISDLNNLNDLLYNNVAKFEDYQISKSKIRNRIFKFLQGANVQYEIAQKTDLYLWKNELVTLSKDLDVFVFEWHYSGKQSKYMINTFIICLGILINECRHLEIDSPKIIVDNRKLSAKDLKNIYSFKTFAETQDVIKLSKIEPKVVITIVDIIIMESALKATYDFLKSSEIIFVKSMEEAIKKMQEYK